jgi:hypothetical protein
MCASPSAGTLAAMNQQSPWRAAVVTAVAAAALLAAACSASPAPAGGTSSTPASAGGPSSAGTGSAPNAGGSADPLQGVAYSQCMRSHGVADFPDPDGSGQIPKETPQQLGISDSVFGAAQQACMNLLPASMTSGTITGPEELDYVKAAACMRSHGVPNFPDPSFSGGQVEFPMLQHIVDLNSPQVIQAYQICRRLIPPGLPYSGSGG